ncbi:MAG: uracil-DNA glycosylase family protein [Muribaculaceae bacterium]
MSDLNIESHPFTPYIPANAKILMLGTFPPKAEKWSMDFYYPNWINDMWRIMGLIFFDNKNIFCDISSKRFHLEAIKSFLNANGIALYDTASQIIRLKDNAADKFLEIVTPIDLDTILNANVAITTIVTTGEKAASVIAEISGTIIPKTGDCEKFNFANREITHYRMPSSSRAYPLSLDKKADAYRRMFMKLGNVNKNL